MLSVSISVAAGDRTPVFVPHKDVGEAFRSSACSLGLLSFYTPVAQELSLACAEAAAILVPISLQGSRILEVNFAVARVGSLQRPHRTSELCVHSGLANRLGSKFRFNF